MTYYASDQFMFTKEFEIISRSFRTTDEIKNLIKPIRESILSHIETTDTRITFTYTISQQTTDILKFNVTSFYN